MSLAPSAAPVAVQARPSNTCRRWFTYFLKFDPESINDIPTPMLPQLDSVVLYLTLTAVCESKVRYRTASDSDRPFIKSVGRQQKAGRYHHPKRAARLGTRCARGSVTMPLFSYLLFIGTLRPTCSLSILWIRSVVLCVISVPLR